jgi:hypothetical protein
VAHRLTRAAGDDARFVVYPERQSTQVSTGRVVGNVVGRVVGRVVGIAVGSAAYLTDATGQAVATPRFSR